MLMNAAMNHFCQRTLGQHVKFDGNTGFTSGLNVPHVSGS